MFSHAKARINQKTKDSAAAVRSRANAPRPVRRVDGNVVYYQFPAHDLPPGEDHCHQPGKHAVSWFVGGFASVIVPGFLAILAGLL